MTLNSDRPNSITPDHPIELPEVMYTPAIVNLAERLGVSESDIRVLRAAAVTWHNSAAGCPQSGVDYAQVLTPGFWVVLEHTGVHYSYHATHKGTLQLCKNARLDPSGLPPDGHLNEDI